MRISHKLILASMLSLSLCYANAQKETLVYLEQCETLSFDENLHPDAQLLKGNVCFRHEEAFMYCDSAYFYQKENSFDAFGHIRFLQGDTLSGFGDRLYYDGNTRMARLRQNVKLINRNTVLTTDSLNYDRANDIAYYFSGGELQDSLNILTSAWGQYTPGDNKAVFREKVLLNHPKFTLRADTLVYNTETHIAFLQGPTRINYGDETIILSRRGWYNTQTEETLLMNRSVIIHADGKSLTGDSLFYDKQKGFGQVYNRFAMTDSIRKATLYGNYGEVYENGKKGYATDSALFVDWSGEDWLYMHADTLFTEEVRYQEPVVLLPDTLGSDSLLAVAAPDTLWKDTAYQSLRAFYGVRVYRQDMQMVCDSLFYHGRDSVMSLCGMPVCWSDENQVSADTIFVYMKNGTIDYAHGVGNAFAVKQEDADRFDQMAGKEMYAYIRNGELRRVEVNGNAETVFFPREDDGTFIGMNKTQSSFVKIFLQDRKIDHIVFTSTTTGTMYPLDSITTSGAHLDGFSWEEHLRPKKPGDVFSPVQRGSIVKQTDDSVTDGGTSSAPAAAAKPENSKQTTKNTRTRSSISRER